MPQKLGDEDIERRVRFLIQEASQVHPVRDQAVSMVLRVLGNYAMFGRDCDSEYVTRFSRFRSHEAHSLYERMVGDPDVVTKVQKERREAWRKRCTNEHQEPLKQIWAWMCETKHELTSAQVRARIGRWPIVVVTKEEDKRLRAHAHRDPESRYREASISVGEISNGQWTPRRPLATEAS